MNTGWAYYLVSLKPYLKKGKGQPSPHVDFAILLRWYAIYSGDDQQQADQQQPGINITGKGPAVQPVVQPAPEEDGGHYYRQQNHENQPDLAQNQPFNGIPGQAQ